MFLGEYTHALDAKGRVVMPSKFRKGLEAGCVVTKGQERCLYVFPMDRWEDEAGRVLTLPRTDRRARNFSRSFFASATDQRLAGQGRIQPPEALRPYAGLKTDLAVWGVADHIRVLDAGGWDRVARGEGAEAGPGGPMGT